MLPSVASCWTLSRGNASRLLRRQLLPKNVLCQRWAAMDDPRHNDGEFHYIPTGASDVAERTRVSFLSKEMAKDQLINIRTISQAGFRINDDSFLYGSIACFPKTALSWRVSTADDITPDSLELFFMLQPKLDVLIIGAGDQKDVDKVRKQVAHRISRHRIGYEIMCTEEAIPTFNFLNGLDHRYVAAALVPPSELIVTESEYWEFLAKQFHVDMQDEVGQYFHLTACMDELGARTAIQRIWGINDNSEKIYNYVTELREQNAAHRMDKLLEKVERDREEVYADSMKKVREARALEEEERKKSLGSEKSVPRVSDGNEKSKDSDSENK